MKWIYLLSDEKENLKPQKLKRDRSVTDHSQSELKQRIGLGVSASSIPLFGGGLILINCVGTFSTAPARVFFSVLELFHLEFPDTSWCCRTIPLLQRHLFCCTVIYTSALICNAKTHKVPFKYKPSLPALGLAA